MLTAIFLNLFRQTAKHAIFFSGQSHNTIIIFSCNCTLFYQVTVNLKVLDCIWGSLHNTYTLCIIFFYTRIDLGAFSLCAANLFKNHTSMVSTFDDAFQMKDRVFSFLPLFARRIFYQLLLQWMESYFLFECIFCEFLLFWHKTHTSYPTCVYIPS